MSRYIVSENPEVVVGWDDPLATFFCQLYDEDGEIVEWRGNTPMEIQSPAAVQAWCEAVGASVSPDILTALERDVQAHPNWTPGPLQKALGFTGTRHEEEFLVRPDASKHPDDGVKRSSAHNTGSGRVPGVVGDTPNEPSVTDQTRPDSPTGTKP